MKKTTVMDLWLVAALSGVALAAAISLGSPEHRPLDLPPWELGWRVLTVRHLYYGYGHDAQRQMAADLGISQQRLDAIERGEVLADDDVIWRLAEKFPAESRRFLAPVPIYCRLAFWQAVFRACALVLLWLWGRERGQPARPRAPAHRV